MVSLYYMPLTIVVFLDFQAARMGHHRAMHNLGVFLANGLGTYVRSKCSYWSIVVLTRYNCCACYFMEPLGVDRRDEARAADCMRWVSIPSLMAFYW